MLDRNMQNRTTCLVVRLGGICAGIATDEKEGLEIDTVSVWELPILL